MGRVVIARKLCVITPTHEFIFHLKSVSLQKALLKDEEPALSIAAKTHPVTYTGVMDKEITIKVDAELLDKVMKLTQFETPDEALEEGLQFISSAGWLEKYWKGKPPHLRPREIRKMVDPNYDPDSPYGSLNTPAPTVAAHAQ